MKNYIHCSRLGMGMALAILLLTAKPFLGQSKPAQNLPTVIEECEDRGDSHLCSTWRWNGKEYEGKWSNGTEGKMSVKLTEIPDAHSAGAKLTRVTFTRHDSKGTRSGLYAVYSGILTNGKVSNGSVQWTFQTIQKAGSWQASFGPAAAPENQTQSGGGAQ